MQDREKNRRGRPSLGEGETVQIALKLPRSLIDAIATSLAERETRAEMIRLAIEREIERRRVVDRDAV